MHWHVHWMTREHEMPHVVLCVKSRRVCINVVGFLILSSCFIFYPKLRYRGVCIHITMPKISEVCGCYSIFFLVLHVLDFIYVFKFVLHQQIYD